MTRCRKYTRALILSVCASRGYTESLCVSRVPSILPSLQPDSASLWLTPQHGWHRVSWRSRGQGPKHRVQQHVARCRLHKKSRTMDGQGVFARIRLGIEYALITGVFFSICFEFVYQVASKSGTMGGPWSQAHSFQMLRLQWKWKEMQRPPVRSLGSAAALPPSWFVTRPRLLWTGATSRVPK